MSARWVTFFVWLVLAATGLFWGLKLFVKAPPAPARLQVADARAAPRGELTRLLGADATPSPAAAAPEPAADARFNLVGVVSPRAPQAAREGVALIAVDGKPPRVYRIGTLVDGTNVLQSVHARGASLGPRGGASTIALKIAPPAAAATGMLPPPDAGAAAQGAPGAPPRAPFTPPQAAPVQRPPPPSPVPNPAPDLKPMK